MTSRWCVGAASVAPPVGVLFSFTLSTWGRVATCRFVTGRTTRGGTLADSCAYALPPYFPSGQEARFLPRLYAQCAGPCLLHNVPPSRLATSHGDDAADGDGAGPRPRIAWGPFLLATTYRPLLPAPSQTRACWWPWLLRHRRIRGRRPRHGQQYDSSLPAEVRHRMHHHRLPSSGAARPHTFTRIPHRSSHLLPFHHDRRQSHVKGAPARYTYYARAVPCVSMLLQAFH